MSGTVANQHEEESVSGFFVSMLFWCSLLAAALLFSAVALAPKLAENRRLADQYTINQLKLVSIERQNEQLQRVVHAIQHDKDFAAELTRIEFDAVRTDEEIIPVTANLKLETRGMELPRIQPAVPRAWYQPWLKLLAESETLRLRLLGAAATLVVVSFTWLQPASTERINRQLRFGRSVWSSLRNRYIKPA